MHRVDAERILWEDQTVLFSGLIFAFKNVTAALDDKQNGYDPW